MKGLQNSSIRNPDRLEKRLVEDGKGQDVLLFRECRLVSTGLFGVTYYLMQYFSFLQWLYLMQDELSWQQALTCTTTCCYKSERWARSIALYC